MNILTIIRWVKAHWRIVVKAICAALTALLINFGISTYRQNLKLSESLEMAQNNIEVYQDALQGSRLTSSVLKLDMADLSAQNDKLIHELDSVRAELGIKAKSLNTAATQTQTLNVNKSKGVRGNIITILKDTVYTDTMLYNDLTLVSYSIGKDSVNIAIDLKNTQYLYIYSKKEYKNKKNFIKRLLTLDFKRVTKYKYKIHNSNDLLKGDSVRIIQQE